MIRNLFSAAMTKRRLAITILTQVLLGPPVGAFVFLLEVNLYEIADSGSGVPGSILFFGQHLVLLTAYILGALPAMISSLFMALLLRRGWSFGRRLAASLPVGAGASVAILGWLLLDKPGAIPWYVILGSIAATGAAAGFVSTLASEPLLRGSRA
jgi:hypothetical protein